MTEAADRKLRLVIITGLSGAGKSETVATFEDLGYFCIDNLPPQMLPGVVELFSLEGSRVDRLALVIDVRGRSYFDHLGEALQQLGQAGVKHQVVFLEASDQTLVTRYQSTRRPHPLAGQSLLEGIRMERRLLAGLREVADVVVDTSGLNVRQLRRRVEEVLLAEELSNQLLVCLMSFGYKYGLPAEADIVLDTRFLPNPYWVPELRPLGGLDREVESYVLDRRESGEFLDEAVRMLRFLAPLFLAEQKRRLVVALGCTGGRHRSVALVEALARRLADEPLAIVRVTHRDLDRSS